MSVKESKIKNSIREYLIEEGLLREKIQDPQSRLEFGFQFSFPPGNDPTTGHPIGQIMAVFKPKNKDLIIISIGTQISPPHVNALDSLGEERKMQFFIELRKFFLIKDVFFQIDIQNYRYEISDQIFINKSSALSKNSFFKSIRRVFNAAAYSNMLLNDFCEGKVKPEDFTKEKGFTAGSNFSLYT